MHDLISRQAAIKAICEEGTWLESQGCTEITMAERKQRDADILGELPSAERKGKWISGKDVPNRNPYEHLADAMYCSECLTEAYWDCDYGQQMFDFCPYCGAKMERREE